MSWPAQWHHPADSPESLAKWAIVPAAVGLVMAIPIATWWLVGDQSTVPASADPDYAFRPLDIGLGAERAAGIGSTVLAVVTLLALVWAARRHHLDTRWWRVLVPLLAAGFIVAPGGGY
jgi:formate hydrogenlyase subunit 3/multisubunit Na+/H+ antiporter MnhD subunit